MWLNRGQRKREIKQIPETRNETLYIQVMEDKEDSFIIREGWKEPSCED